MQNFNWNTISFVDFVHWKDNWYAVSQFIGSWASEAQSLVHFSWLYWLDTFLRLIIFYKCVYLVYLLLRISYKCFCIVYLYYCLQVLWCYFVGRKIICFDDVIAIFDFRKGQERIWIFHQMRNLVYLFFQPCFVEDWFIIDSHKRVVPKAQRAKMV